MCLIPKSTVRKIVVRTLQGLLLGGVLFMLCRTAVAQSEEPLSIEQQMAFDDLEMLLTELRDGQSTPYVGDQGIVKSLTILSETDGRLLTIVESINKTLGILIARIKAAEVDSIKEDTALIRSLTELQKTAHADFMKLFEDIRILQAQDKALLKRITALEAKGKVAK